MERSVPGRNPDEAVSTQRALHVCYGSAMDEAVGVAKLAQVSLRSVYVSLHLPLTCLARRLALNQTQQLVWASCACRETLATTL